MYSLILMAAMTTPADTPAWGLFKHGCHGCNGSCTGSCTGGHACTGSHASCVGSHPVAVNGSCYGAAHGPGELRHHHVPDPVPGIGKVEVGLVLHPGDTARPEVGLKLRPRDVEQGTHNLAVPGIDGAESGESGATNQLQQQRLGLVVERVADGDGLGPGADCRALQEVVPHPPRHRRRKRRPPPAPGRRSGRGRHCPCARRRQSRRRARTG